jgi:hypothetical protein
MRSELRKLVDLLGALGELVAYRDRRVAVIGESYACQPFAEREARRRGFQLRYFGDAGAALAWLHGEH